jgi:ribose transport system substrate-binding protein
MKKLSTKMVLFALVAALAFSIVGCSASNTPAASQSPSTSAQTSTAAPASQAAASSSTQTKSGGFVVGLSNGYFGNTWRTQFLDDIQKVADDYKQQGVIKDFLVSNASSDAEQIAAVNSFVAQKVDAIIVVPRVETALTPIIKKATDAGIKVISIDDSSWDNCINVVNDNTIPMTIATEWMADQLKGTGNIVYINGVPGENWDNLRNNEVNAVLAKNTGIKLLATAPGQWADAEANKATTTLLNTYKNIDGVLAQDVMGRGIVQAFQTANRPFVPMIGDFVFGYLRLWDTLPDLNAFTYTFPPGIGADSLMVTVNLLKGKTLKDSSFSQNAFNDKLKNSVVMPLPYYVVRNLPTDNPQWYQDATSKGSKVITLKDALAMGEGKDDNTAIDFVRSQSDIDALFK